MFINVSKLSDAELHQLAAMSIAEVSAVAQKELLRRQNTAVAGLVAGAASKFMAEFRQILDLTELEPVTVIIRTVNRSFSFQSGNSQIEKRTRGWPAGSKEKTAQLVREITGWDSDLVERRLKYGWKIFARRYRSVAEQVEAI